MFDHESYRDQHGDDGIPFSRSDPEDEGEEDAESMTRAKREALAECTRCHIAYLAAQKKLADIMIAEEGVE